MITSDRQLSTTNKKIESLQESLKKLIDEAKVKPLAKSAKIQKYGEAFHFPQMNTGFYDKNKPLTQEDIDEIKIEIRRLLESEKYIIF